MIHHTTQQFIIPFLFTIIFCLLLYYVVGLIYKIVDVLKAWKTKPSQTTEERPPWYGKIIFVSELQYSHQRVSKKETKETTPINMKSQDEHLPYSTLFEKSSEDEVSKRRSPIFYFIRNLLLFCLAFVIPIVGAIIYVMMRDYHPKDARYPGIGSFLGFILIFVMAFLPLFLN